MSSNDDITMDKESGAAFETIKKNHSKLIALETNATAQDILLNALTTLVKRLKEVTAEFKGMAVTVRSVVSGTETEQREKCELFNEIYVNVTNVAIRSVSRILLDPDIDKWNKLTPSVKFLMARSAELVKSGTAPSDALRQAIEESDVDEEAKTAAIEILSKRVASSGHNLSDGSDGPEVPDVINQCAFISELLRGLIVAWDDDPNNMASKPASLFGADSLQTTDSADVEDPVAKAIRLIQPLMLDNTILSSVDLAKKLNDIARFVYLKNKGWDAAFIVSVTQDFATKKPRKGIVILPVGPSMNDDARKDVLSITVKRLVYDFKADTVVMITEAWLLESKEKSTIRPKDSKDRVECLLLTLDTKTGTSVTISNAIVRDDLGNVTLGEAEVTESLGIRKASNESGGVRFGNYWPE